MSGSNTVAPDALLERIARALKTEIAPAVGEAYPKTQAFMASVVLHKLAGEIRSAEEHDARNRAATEALARELLGALETIEAAPPVLRETVEALRCSPDGPALTRVVQTLYTTREALGAAAFADLLGRVRVVLRARIDRALEYSA